MCTGASYCISSIKYEAVEVKKQNKTQHLSWRQKKKIQILFKEKQETDEKEKKYRKPAANSTPLVCELQTTSESYVHDGRRKIKHKTKRAWSTGPIQAPPPLKVSPVDKNTFTHNIKLIFSWWQVIISSSQSLFSHHSGLIISQEDTKDHFLVHIFNSTDKVGFLATC